MRLFNHFHFRQTVAKLQDSHKGDIDKTFHLTPDASWTDGFFDESSVKYRMRKLYS